MTLVTEAGTKRRSGSRAYSVCPLDRSTSSTTGMAGSTGALVEEGSATSAIGAASGTAGHDAKARAINPIRAI